MTTQHTLPAKPLTSGRHHFFGYYDKFPWNQSGRYHLALQTSFLDRQPTRNDKAIIGRIDSHNGNRFEPVAETSAWSWQQGTMLQWLPSEPEHTIIYNDRITEDGADRFIAVIHNLETGEKRQLPRAIYTVSDTHALSLNYSRLHVTRPGYGYPDAPGDRIGEPFPDDDGIWSIDLETGESRLVISLGQLHRNQTSAGMQGRTMWVNHLTFSPEGNNFVFLNRWHNGQKGRPFDDRFYCADADGSHLRLIHDQRYFSHFGYFSEDRLVGYARMEENRDGYALFDLNSGARDELGADVFNCDGHCSFSSDRKWMMTDTYPDAEHQRTLILFEMKTGQRIDIGKFYSPPELAGELRCDLHPRWSRDGRKVSIDSAHTGERQIYEIDVGEITG